MAPDLNLSATALALVLVLAAVTAAGLAFLIVTIIRAIVRPRDW